MIVLGTTDEIKIANPSSDESAIIIHLRSRGVSDARASGRGPPDDPRGWDETRQRTDGTERETVTTLVIRADPVLIKMPAGAAVRAPRTNGRDLSTTVPATDAILENAICRKLRWIL